MVRLVSRGYTYRLVATKVTIQIHMMNKVVVFNVFINVLMVALYICCFGYQSVERYNRMGITTISMEEKQSSLGFPGKISK